ncbi:hypothetical protein PHISCL_06458 [Aspergillus sclerotialis]|uniref:Uncharacterized protein n=1 Tax=Aspergillus sclerotialis TaxID=2070753 RepID=A0A3A2ZTB9_9EURO|nr:hypothetical protein PHISCL_06458 [Aspergillus sclerotialis]
MIFLPLIGILITVALWGSYIPVPGFISPHESFVKRLTGAMHFTTMTKGIHDLAEVMTTVYDAGHINSTYIQYPYLDYVDSCNITYPVTPGSDILLGIKLWEGGITTSTTSSPSEFEPAFAAPAVDVGIDDDEGREWGSSFASEAGDGNIMAGCVGVLNFISVLWLAYTLSDQRRERDASIRSLVGGDLSFGDVGPSFYEGMDLLIAGQIPWTRAQRVELRDRAVYLTGFAAETSLAKQQRESVSILRQVEKAISRLELQRAVFGIYAELERKLNDQEARISDSSDDARTNAAQVSSKVTDSAADLRQARQLALVVRRPENLSPVMVYQFVCSLAANWERHTASAVASSPEDPPAQTIEDQTESGAEEGSAPATGRKKRQRPSRSKRQRQRRAREQQDRPDPALERPQAQHSGTAAAFAQPYGPGYGQAGGPPLAPAVMAHPSPWQYMPGPLPYDPYYGPHY